jgi:hypothetical protein
VCQRILESLKTKRDADDADETRDQEDLREIIFLILFILPCSASSASLFIWTPRIVGTPSELHDGLKNLVHQDRFGLRFVVRVIATASANA